MAAIARWFYRGKRPNRLAKVMNRGQAWIHGLGILPRFLVSLEIEGHRSGRVRVMPMVVAEYRGERFLVSMLGDGTAWVRDARAAGRAVLRHGRAERVRLVEVPAGERAPILKAYLRRAPGARPHVSVGWRAPESDFEAIAGAYPVFRIVATETRAEA
jgi:hypothetical protein